MKRFLFAIVLATGLLAGSNSFSQTPNSTAVSAFSYQMQESDGTNGSGVAYDPASKTYFVVIAGNASFPLESFRVNGKTTVPVKSGQAGEDLRGIWCNPKSAALQGNMAGEGGYVSRSLSSNGNLGSWKTLFEGQYQPDFQSVGTFDAKKKQVVFFNPSSFSLELRSLKAPEKYKMLQLDQQAVMPEDMNQTSLGFTGVKGYEFALMDVSAARLVYFNRKGQMTGSTKLPSDAPIYDYFAFGIANGKLFLYDKEERVWLAYEIF